MAPGSDSWLSLTPEPERELPRAVATLRAGGEPDPRQVEAERARAERLIGRARRRAYRRWLADARGLAAQAQARDPHVRAARQLTLDVLENHDALALGLTPRGRGEGDAGR